MIDQYLMDTLWWWCVIAAIVGYVVYILDISGYLSRKRPKR